MRMAAASALCYDHARSMSRNVLDLSALVWQFGQAPRQPFSSQPRDDRAAVVGWLPARVPGDVRADLLAVGRLSALDTPEELAASSWVDEADWWYRTEIDAAEPGQTSVLEADGIDYLSAVYLDDERLATHQGMFGRQSIVLPGRVSSGKQELAVRVWGAGALPRLADSLGRRAARALVLGWGLTSEYFPERMATPKAQFSFGWDFSPRVLSTGIWDDIRIVRCRGAYLAGVHAVAAPLAECEDPIAVRWELHLSVVRFGDRPLRAVVELHEAGGASVPLAQDTFDLADGREVSLVFDSPPLARWWPWDQGDPRRYRLTVKVVDDRGAADELETTVGVRTVRRERFPKGAPWRFMINGRPVFLRGANWVPADILPGRVAAGTYAHLIGLARTAGVNFLRVWGGGIREKRAFWEQCNRLGIMAMQEFPLACAFLDHYPRDGAYLSVLGAEARGMVSALRNHPSLIAWCGGNEINPRRERLPLRTIERVLNCEDRTRPWIPASPADGDVHQWDVWHGGAPWQSLARVKAPFMSEFGLQALPDAATVHDMFGAGVPESLDDPRWARRKLQAGKLRHYAGPLPRENGVATVVPTIVGTIVATQRAQAAAIQAGIEGCRLRREGSGDKHPCGGVAFWQWNEPWPAVSWSVLDGEGRPKAAFDMLVRSYQPLLVAARFERREWRAGEQFQAEIWLVNDAPRALDDCAVSVQLDGQPVHTFTGVVVLAGSVTRVVSLSVQLDSRPQHLVLRCLRNGAIIAENRYDLAVFLPPPQPVGAWLVRRAGDLLLR